MTVNITHDAAEAKNTAKQSLVVGILVTVFGVLLTAATSPSTTVDTFTGAAVEHGSKAGYVAGLALIGAGATLAWVAVIAWAVSLGVRMGRR